MVKSAGFDADVFEGTARVFERRTGRAGRPGGRHDHRRATSSSSATRAPRAGRACARCSPSPERSRARAWARTSCCITDGRFSGGTTGLCVGHIAPEAVDAGPIAFVRDGDRIRLDVRSKRLDLLVDDAELAARRTPDWKPLPHGYRRGVLAKYTKLVQSASKGAVLE